MRDKWADGLTAYGMVAVATVLVAAAEGDVLYTAAEQSLFLHTPLFFRQSMVAPGGLLTWAAAYLTQWGHYPAVGTALLGVLWLLVAVLCRRTFRLGSPWPALVPVACLLLTVGSLGYWLFYVKLRGVLFVATVGTLVVLVLLRLFLLLPARWWVSAVAVVGATAVGYPLFGFYGLWAVVLMGLVPWTSTDGAWTSAGGRVAVSVAAVAAVVAVPLLCYGYVYHETHLSYIYSTALPVFALHGESYPRYYAPYVVLVGSSVVLMFAGRLRSAFCRPATVERLRQARWLSPLTARVVLLAVLAVGVGCSWTTDDNFHRELAMRRSIDHHDWQQVLTLARGAKDEPTRAMTMMQGLALFRTGQTGGQMTAYPRGCKPSAAPFATRMVHTYGKVLYLEYGLPNYCYRWCMEDGVEYGWRAEQLKLMTLCSLVSGELVAAQRFINLLKKTDCHRQWALAYEPYAYRPQLTARDPHLRAIFPLLRADNFLTADQSQQELFLFEHFLSTPGDTREQQELARFTMSYYRYNRHPLPEP